MKKKAQKAVLFGLTVALSTATQAGASPTKAAEILKKQIAKYPILEGATVEYGDAKGHQAICYYSSGRIIIDRRHKAPLKKIIGHEIWHIIDWRNNGKIDWGENVPPKRRVTD